MARVPFRISIHPVRRVVRGAQPRLPAEQRVLPALPSRGGGRAGLGRDTWHLVVLLKRYVLPI